MSRNAAALLLITILFYVAFSDASPEVTSPNACSADVADGSSRCLSQAEDDSLDLRDASPEGASDDVDDQEFDDGPLSEEEEKALSEEEDPEDALDEYQEDDMEPLEGEEAMAEPQDGDEVASLASEALQDMDSSSRTLADKAKTPQHLHSKVLGCEAVQGPHLNLNFVESVKPCGTFVNLCTDLPVVEANLDYPGGGPGNVIPGQDYVVQFDIGIHPRVARDILHRRLKEIDSCISCPEYEETCLEVIVSGGDHWGDLNVSGLHTNAYNCMGGCGKGCAVPKRGKVINHIDVGALDCLKHDVCSAYKSVKQGYPAVGFCNDPDCGDEAAHAIYNCWKGWRFFGSLGSQEKGRFSEPVICSKAPNIKGCWSHSGWFTPGRCKIYSGWDRGQGIPDPHPLRSPLQRF